MLPDICKKCANLGTVCEFDALTNTRTNHYFCWEKFDKLTNFDIKNCINFEELIHTKKNCAYYCDKNESACETCIYWVRDILYIDEQKAPK